MGVVLIICRIKRSFIFYTHIYIYAFISVDLEKIRDAFGLTMLIRTTKIDSLIDNVSQLNVSITDAQITTSFDKLNLTLAALYRDKGYDYFFEENATTTNENGSKRMRLRSE
jgi:hypothetical protein